MAKRCTDDDFDEMVDRVEDAIEQALTSCGLCIKQASPIARLATQIVEDEIKRQRLTKYLAGCFHD